MRIVENENKELVAKIKEGLKRKDNHCPCRRDINDDTLCMCKEFREQIKDPNFEGYCLCMLFYKYKD